MQWLQMGMGFLNVLKLDSGDSCITVSILKITELYQVKGWIFVCELHLNIAVTKKQKINDPVAMLINSWF